MTRPFVKGYGPPCPHCGHITSRRVSNGWSEPDDHYLRYKKCDGCKGQFTTVEVAVPVDATTFYRLDYHGRELRRERWRRKYAKTLQRHMPQKSDQLYVKVRVKRSREFDVTHCFRGHEFTPENTYLRPNGWRRCKLCRDIVAHSYYLKQRGAA
jgi:hypothetical protein